MAKCCPKYSAGDLREVVAIEAGTRTSDGQGGYTVAWAAVSGAPTRAMVKAAPGNERWGFMRTVPGNIHQMVTRYFAGHTSAQKVTWGSKELGVLGVVDPDGRGQWLEWRLSDGVAS